MSQDPYLPPGATSPMFPSNAPGNRIDKKTRDEILDPEIQCAYCGQARRRSEFPNRSYAKCSNCIVAEKEEPWEKYLRRAAFEAIPRRVWRGLWWAWCITATLAFFFGCGSTTDSVPEDCEIIKVEQDGEIERLLVCGGGGYEPKQEHKPR